MDNLTVPGLPGCVAPCPTIDAGNLVLWGVFQRLSRRRGAFAFAGMDGDIQGIREEAYREAVEAAGLLWSEETQDRFAICETYWIREVDRLMKDARERAKRKAKSEARG